MADDLFDPRIDPDRARFLAGLLSPYVRDPIGPYSNLDPEITAMATEAFRVCREAQRDQKTQRQRLLSCLQAMVDKPRPTAWERLLTDDGD